MGESATTIDDNGKTNRKSIAIWRDYQNQETGNSTSEQHLRGEPISTPGERLHLLLMGNSGTGKTHLATALGLTACQQGKNVRFFTAAGLINQLTEAQAALRLSHVQKALAKLDLLIIDEIGYVPFSERGAELFFQVVADSYERQSIIMTTNLDFSKWPQVFH
ncbi:MAG: ATP-binding protein, partial [Acidobacteriota bacterium]